MKKTAIAALLLTLTACATHTKSYQPSPQFYRAKGQETQTQITAKQDVTYSAYGRVRDNKITIFFDGEPLINGTLDNTFSGEFNGKPFNNKPTSASCTSRQVTETWAELKCIVFIDNERAATLTM